jgi:hypothetical protein
MSRILAREDVSFIQESGKVLEVRIRLSKTDQHGASCKLKIERSTYLHMCPVEALEDYLSIRHPRPGPLFMHFGGDPLTSYQLRSILKKK